MDCSALCIIIITLFFPPVGVFLISGCGADLLINICLTILGYFPGHIHAFYLEYVYYHRKNLGAQGTVFSKPATGVYSDRIQTGGHRGTAYGTM
ncbi:putative stress response RCI peptide [Talaromyces proteolyticus]|uniref:Stress response RCI peptide n=1 Tax=Talaromyces proteolyticus TaxID=1131652 RepID=A0AAD4KZ01_9EURO|nr:putative stress response RCI peptide [Talaromyces proteolyticus]KAH8702137.1 putative stress response RCI peptide [Talaromyces proteolyticus]